MNEAQQTIEEFHRLWHPLNDQTRWLGHQLLKCPFDLFIYQELLWELRPDLIIECGTHRGGSALFLASMLDLIGSGEIVTIDSAAQETPPHSRVTYLDGDALAPRVLDFVRARAARAACVLVILDDDHHADHVLDELRAYSNVVTRGSYLIVEDTNIGHSVHPEFGDGPMEAVQLFLALDERFESDRSREKFLLTFNPRGYLRKR